MSIDGIVRKLLYGSLIVFNLNVFAQSSKNPEAPALHGVASDNSASVSDDHASDTSASIPVLPAFNRSGIPDLPLVHTEGYVKWKSEVVRKSSPKYIMHGLVDIDLKLLFYKTHLSFGVITEMKDSLLESTVYSLKEEDRSLTPYKMALAASKGIDTTELSSLCHVFFDYKNSRMIYPEGDSVKALPYGVLDLQTGLARFLDRTTSADTTITVWYKDEIFPINANITCSDTGYTVKIDLRKPSPKDPNEKINIFPLIDNLTIKTDIYKRPTYVSANGKILLGIPVSGEVRLEDFK